MNGTALLPKLLKYKSWLPVRNDRIPDVKQDIVIEQASPAWLEVGGGIWTDLRTMDVDFYFLIVLKDSSI